MNELQQRKLLERAESYYRANKLAAAKDALNRLRAGNPKHTRASELLAYLAGREGNTEFAFELLKGASRQPDSSASLHYHLGSLYLVRHEIPEAIAAFRESVRKGECFENLHELGTALSHGGFVKEALDTYKRAEYYRSDVPELFFNLGRMHDAMGEFDSAVAAYDKCISLEPRFFQAWSNRAVTLNDLKRYEEALASFSKASSLAPEDPETSWNESLTRLLLGDYERGWECYEKRWKSPGHECRRHINIPLLENIGDAAHKRVLIWAEQGFGDSIQFSRYLPLLGARGADVVFEVQDPLRDLMRSMPGITVVGPSDSVEDVAFQCPLMSLPRLFETRLHSIPCPERYLAADPEKIEAWRRRLGLTADRLNIGIACSGRESHKNDHLRSMNLAEFAPLAERYNLVLIQKDIRPADRIALEKYNIPNVSGEINDFSDTAAVVENMDLVVSVDTALAHLAGALGKPVCVLLAWSPEWRWLLDRDDSPWYSTARLFRQPSPGDWASVIRGVVQAIPALCACTSAQ